MKKEYQFEVKIISDIAIISDSAEEARDIIKDIYAEEHNIDLTDEEINFIEGGVSTYLTKFMIEYFEVAPSSKSNCQKCGKRIEKGEGRGVYIENYRGYATGKFLCLKCSKKVLQGLLKNARDYISVE